MAEVTVSIDLDEVDMSEMLDHIKYQAKRGCYIDSITRAFDEMCGTSINDHIGVLNSRIHSLEKEVETLKIRMARHQITTPEQDAAEIARLKTLLRKNGIPV